MDLGEWPLVISIIGAFLASATLARAAVRDMADHLDRRFVEAEARRQDASTAWQERLQIRDRVCGEHRGEIIALQQQMTDLKEHIADNYVSRHTWMEHVGSTNIKLDKLLDKLRAPSGLHDASTTYVMKSTSCKPTRWKRTRWKRPPPRPPHD